MDYKRTIELFLLDKTPNGRLICTLSNWSGKVFRIPRNHIKDKDNTSRQELYYPGIYFLFGKDDTKDRPLVYIGEAERVMDRLKQHLVDKDNWHEAIIVVGDESYPNKAHIKYLESSFYDLAQKCNRYSIDNSTIPTKSSISESDQGKMEEFMDNTKMLVNVLGHKVFERYTDKDEEEEDAGIFYISTENGKARGTPTSDGFVLLEGSFIHDNTKDSLLFSLKKKVEDSRINGQIKDNILQEDILFSSSSAAAAFAVGHSISGPQSWKTTSGKTLISSETEPKR